MEQPRETARRTPSLRALSDVAKTIAPGSSGRQQNLRRLPVVRELATYPMRVRTWLASQPVVMEEVRREERLDTPFVTPATLAPAPSTMQKIRQLAIDGQPECLHGLRKFECASCNDMGEPIPPPGTTGGAAPDG